MHRPRHARPRTGSRASRARWCAAFLGAASMAAGVGLAVATPAGASTAGCNALGPSCGDNQNAFGNGWDVYQQAAAYNNKVISWPNGDDKATDFIRAGTNPYRYQYAPGGHASGLCVADPAGGGVPASDPHGLVLRGCNTGNWQLFQLGKADSAGRQQLVNVATGLPVQTNGTGAQLTGGGSYAGGSYWTWEGGPKLVTSVTPMSFSLYRTGDASATCQFHQEVLNAGTSTGAGAYVLVNSPAAAAPSAPPGFTTSGELAGTPRWVIEFHNGQLVYGYPAAASGSGDSTTWTWVAPFASVSGSYSAAVAAATSASSGLDNWVTAAFIVDDQSASLGDVSLTGVQYGGVTYTC